MNWLQDIAHELTRRGSPALARKARAVAALLKASSTEFPEADELPPNPPQPDEDVIKTGDYGSNLRVPPYDHRRPKTEGDDAED